MAFTEDGSDPDSLIECPCCPLDHHHGEAANACPGGHDDDACPQPETCRVFPGEGCDGGHCAKGVPGCTVCRPITITAMPGSAALRGMS